MAGRKHAINHKVHLLQMEPSQGRSAPVVKTEKMVYANVYEMSITAQAAQLQIGDRASYSMEIWRVDYRDFYTHCRVDGVTYKIDGVYRTDNALTYRLVLVRG